MSPIYPSNSFQATIIYVEKTLNADFNRYISTNYHAIAEKFEKLDIQFLYLPLLLQDIQYQKVLDYNRPYLKSNIDNNQINSVYAKLLKLTPETASDQAFAYIRNYYSGTEDIKYYQLIETLSFESQISECIVWLNKFISEKEERDHGVQFRQISGNQLDLNSKPLYKKIFDESELSLSEAPVAYDPDKYFNNEAFNLAQEVRDKIQQLRELGLIKIIDDIIEAELKVRNKLSSLFITNDYRIFLKDYEMKEVVMAPLPKAVYLLFLRHPEGILFKHLIDYRDELMSIYRNVTNFMDINRAIESINAITAPCSNSINENCSRIRSAFVNVIADKLAANYYITGFRGEPKKITLNRELVIFQ